MKLARLAVGLIVLAISLPYATSASADDAEDAANKETAASPPSGKTNRRADWRCMYTYGSEPDDFSNSTDHAAACKKALAGQTGFARITGTCGPPAGYKAFVPYKTTLTCKLDDCVAGPAVCLAGHVTAGQYGAVTDALNGKSPAPAGDGTPDGTSTEAR